MRVMTEEISLSTKGDTDVIDITPQVQKKLLTFLHQKTKQRKSILPFL